MPVTLSFPKARRLTRTAEFDRVRSDGKVWRGELIKLAVASSPMPNEPMRLGIIASRKVGSAVVRNRVRRRLREIVRGHQHEIAGGVWLVAIISERAAGASYQQLKDEWLRLASRASILAP
ncbi:MAG TPA: ribonuclease P protein component [Chthoniobacterales bacterium]